MKTEQLTTKRLIETAKQFTLKRHTMPVLGTIFFNCNSVRAMDLNTEYQVTYDTKGQHGLLLAEHFKPFAANLPVKFQAIDDKLDFPAALKLDPDKTKTIATDNLEVADLLPNLKALLRTASKDEYRYNIYGIYIDGAQAVSTNGHIMTYFPSAFCENYQSETKLIVSRNSVEKICHWLSKLQKTDRVTITTDTTFIHFSSGAETVTARLVGGQYPDYKQVMQVDRPIFWTTLGALRGFIETTRPYTGKDSLKEDIALFSTRGEPAPMADTDGCLPVQYFNKSPDKQYDYTAQVFWAPIETSEPFHVAFHWHNLDTLVQIFSKDMKQPDSLRLNVKQNGGLQAVLIEADGAASLLPQMILMPMRTE